jgi:hypothetical protein
MLKDHFVRGSLSLEDRPATRDLRLKASQCNRLRPGGIGCAFHRASIARGMVEERFAEGKPPAITKLL